MGQGSCPEPPSGWRPVRAWPCGDTGEGGPGLGGAAPAQVRRHPEEGGFTEGSIKR